MAPKNELPSQDVLLKLLRYDEDTGKLYWNVRPIEFFEDTREPAVHTQAKWNSRWAGKEAFTKINVGYHCGRLLYQYVLAHRVIWKMMTGSDPDQVDHISGDRADNRWANLREVTTTGNRKNQAKRTDNTSGCVGVTFDKRMGLWVAQIGVKAKTKYIGAFQEIEDAIAARKAAEVQYGFHPNHGRTAALSVPKEA